MNPFHHPVFRPGKRLNYFSKKSEKSGNFFRGPSSDRVKAARETETAGAGVTNQRQGKGKEVRQMATAKWQKVMLLIFGIAMMVSGILKIVNALH